MYPVDLATQPMNIFLFDVCIHNADVYSGQFMFLLHIFGVNCSSSW